MSFLAFIIFFFFKLNSSIHSSKLMDKESFEKTLLDEDLSYEIQILKDPNSLDNWINYINYKRESNTNDPLTVIPIQFRALKAFPNNKQLQEMYLSSRIELLGQSDDPNEIKSVLNVFKGIIENIESSDLNWFKRYTDFIVKYSKVIGSKIIQCEFNWMLTKLTPFDHSLIWIAYFQCLKQLENPLSIILRYWKWVLEVSKLDLFIPGIWDLEETFKNICELIMDIDQLPVIDPLFQKLVKLNIPQYPIHFHKFQTYIKVLKNSKDFSILELITNQFNDLIVKFSDKRIELIKLYGEVLFEFKSPEIGFEFYDIQLRDCNSMVEFAFIFDSFSSLLESRCTKLLESEGEKSENLLATLDKLESLLSNRDILVNDLKLRKDKNCVKYWLERLLIYKNDRERLLETYSQAVLTIDMSKTNEKQQLAKLWCKYSMEYFHLKDYETCVNLFEIAINIPWDNIAQKEYVVIGYTNMLIDLNKDLTAGMKLLYRVLESNSPNLDKTFDISKSLKLWSYYIDLSISLGNANETIRLYEKSIELKIISGVMILNYCEFLIGLKLFKRAFSIYERAIDMFSGETKWIISGVYLNKLLKNFKISNLDQQEVRSIFENCIDNEFQDERQFEFSLLYVKWELEHGSKVKAITILKGVINSTNSQTITYQSFKMIVGLSQGLKSIETVLVQAVNLISCNTNGFIDELVPTLVKVEIEMNSISKARQVIKYASETIMIFGKTAELRKAVWTIWKQFELENGDESSYKEMLQFKRLLESTSKPLKELEDTKKTNHDVGFIISSTMNHENEGSQNVVNEDAIELEMDDFN